METGAKTVVLEADVCLLSGHHAGAYGKTQVSRDLRHPDTGGAAGWRKHESIFGNQDRRGEGV